MGEDRLPEVNPQLFQFKGDAGGLRDIQTEALDLFGIGKNLLRSAIHGNGAVGENDNAVSQGPYRPYYD